MNYFKNLNFNNDFFKLGLITLLLVVILETCADVFNWYYIFPHLDTPMHIFGGMLVGFFALAYTPRNCNLFQKFMWVIVGVLAIGILLEIVEWTLDTRAHLGVMLQQSSLDTFTDILHDFFGGVIVFALGYFSRRIN